MASDAGNLSVFKKARRTESGERERWKEGERGRRKGDRVGGSERERERERIYVLHDDVTPYNEIMNPSQRLGINGFRLENDKEA